MSKNTSLNGLELVRAAESANNDADAHSMDILRGQQHWPAKSPKIYNTRSSSILFKSTASFSTPVPPQTSSFMHDVIAAPFTSSGISPIPYKKSRLNANESTGSLSCSDEDTDDEYDGVEYSFCASNPKKPEERKHQKKQPLTPGTYGAFIRSFHLLHNFTSANFPFGFVNNIFRFNID